MSKAMTTEFYIRFGNRYVKYGASDDLRVAIVHYNRWLFQNYYKERIQNDGLWLCRHVKDAKDTVLAKGFLTTLPAYPFAKTVYYVHAVSELQPKLVELAEGRYEVLDSDWDIDVEDVNGAA